MAIKRKTHLNLSGSHHTLDSDNGFIGGTLYITGSLSSSAGITGSIQYVDGASTQFITASSNITVNYNSLGQWEITGSGGGGTNYFTEIALDSIATTGSVAMTFLSASTGAEITGSLSNGSGTTASGQYSHAEGSSTTASGQAAHAEGNLTTASGFYSHAEGLLATAAGADSHAEGVSTNALAYGSHAEGYFTTAEGEYAHAQGYSTKASGTGSFAAGLGTVASGSIDGASPPLTTQAAFGKYNIDNNTDSLFVVGDGFDVSNRHDVLRVNSGSVQVTGSLIAPTITGSIQYVDDANSISYITASSNITVNYNSLGQWEITGSGGGGTNYFTEIALNSIETTGSVAMTFLSASTGAEITGSFNITGSVTAVTDVFNINGFNIVPLWNHATTSQAVPNTLLSGSLLVDNMPADGIGLFDMNVVATDDAAANFGSWKMVVTMTASSNVTSVAGVTELDNILVGTDGASWDVNVNGTDIEVTGSLSGAGSVYWMAKLTHKMVLSSSGQVIY